MNSDEFDDELHIILTNPGGIRLLPTMPSQQATLILVAVALGGAVLAAGAYLHAAAPLLYPTALRGLEVGVAAILLSWRPLCEVLSTTDVAGFAASERRRWCNRANVRRLLVNP